MNRFSAFPKTPVRFFAAVSALATAGTATTIATTAAAATTQAEAVAKISASFDTAEQLARIRLDIAPDLKFNYDGPWKLEITGPLVDLGKAKTPLDKTAFDEREQHFLIRPTQKLSAAQAGSSKWRLVYFLCNKTNTWCKRLTANGTF